MGHLLQQVLARGGGRVGERGGDLDDVLLLAELVPVDDRLHRHEVDHALEVPLGADRQLDRHGVGAEPVDHRLHTALEVGADAIHLVDVGDPRDVVLVGLAPHGLRLRLDAGDGVEQRDRPVEHAQRALDLDGEVDVPGRVDDVDAVVLPLRGGGGRGDRDAALLLLFHPIHRGGAVVDLADLVGAPRVVEDALGRGRLARVDVGHDPDVAGVLECELTWHGLGCGEEGARLGQGKTAGSGQKNRAPWARARCVSEAGSRRYVLRVFILSLRPRQALFAHLSRPPSGGRL